MTRIQRSIAGVTVLLTTANAFAMCQESTIVKMIDAGFKPDYIMAICPVGLPPATQPAERAANSRSGTQLPNQTEAAKSTPSTKLTGGTAAPPTPGQGTESPTAGAADTQKKAAGSTPDPRTFTGSPPNKLTGSITTKVAIPGFAAVVEPTKEFIAPAGSRFTVNNDVIENGVEKLYVTFKTNKPTTYATGAPYTTNGETQYVVERNALNNYDHNYFGWTYGVLTAPYKFQFSDRSFGSSATVGPYIGRVLEWSNSSAKWVLSAGLTSVPIATTQVGSTATTNRAALSFSTGLLWTLNKEFELGFLVGSDVVGPNSQYQYNGKPWLALDIGYKFGN